MSVSSKRSMQSVVSVSADSGLKVDFARLHRAVTYEEMIHEFVAAKFGLESRGETVASTSAIKGLLGDLGVEKRTTTTPTAASDLEHVTANTSRDRS
jgi:hypothetical protein